MCSKRGPKVAQQVLQNGYEVVQDWFKRAANVAQKLLSKGASTGDDVAQEWFKRAANVAQKLFSKCFKWL